MLKERVKELIDRYENGEEWLSTIDVQDELEEILDEEPWGESEDLLYEYLKSEIDQYILQRHYAERGGGRIPDGGDDFIRRVEEIIGYNENEA